MNMYLVIFLLEDYGVEYQGHWTGWVEGDENDAVEQASVNLIDKAETQFERDMIMLAYMLWKDDRKNSYTIVEVIG